MKKETYSFVSLIGKKSSLELASVISQQNVNKTQYISFYSTLQLISGISTDAQKLLK